MFGNHWDEEWHELLFETDKGSVQHCRCCGSLEVRFGNAIIGLSAEDFNSFRKVIAGAESKQYGEMLYIGDTGSGFAFKAHELTEMHRLLEGAHLLLTVSGDVSDNSSESTRPNCFLSNN